MDLEFFGLGLLFSGLAWILGLDFLLGHLIGSAHTGYDSGFLEGNLNGFYSPATDFFRLRPTSTFALELLIFGFGFGFDSVTTGKR